MVGLRAEVLTDLEWFASLERANSAATAVPQVTQRTVQTARNLAAVVAVQELARNPALEHAESFVSGA